MKIYSRNTAVLLVSVSIYLTSCSGDQSENEVKKDNPVKVEVAIATKKGSSTIHASGQIESEQTAMISTRVMGFITSIKVKTGDNVKKGQLLVAISNGDILAKRAQALAAVTEAEAALKDAQKDYERFTELFKQQSASEKELENAALHYQSVKAKAEAARQMQNEAEAMLSYTNLTAPFSGVVTQKNSNEGSMANPGMPLLVIEQPGNYQVRTSVAEEDIDQVRQGAAADIVIKSNGKVVNGVVTEVSPSSQMSGGQYYVKIKIPEQEKSGLYSGMFVNVSIASSGKSELTDNTILVPSHAIVQKDQLVGLYTVSENQTALLRWVKTGKTQGDQIEILSGLTENEKFIVTSEGRLYNGVQVIVK